MIGVFISAIGVYFFWQKKKATFDYGMDARTLKTIRIRKRIYSENAQKAMLEFNIDTLKIATILNDGDVNFGQSKPRQKPCAEYHVTGKKELKKVSFEDHSLRFYCYCRKSNHELITYFNYSFQFYKDLVVYLF